MSGASNKWYLKNLRQSKFTSEARTITLERGRGETSFSQKEKKTQSLKCTPAEKRRRG